MTSLKSLVDPKLNEDDVSILLVKRQGTAGALEMSPAKRPAGLEAGKVWLTREMSKRAGTNAT